MFRPRAPGGRVRPPRRRRAGSTGFWTRSVVSAGRRQPRGSAARPPPGRGPAARHRPSSQVMSSPSCQEMASQLLRWSAKKRPRSRRAPRFRILENNVQASALASRERFWIIKVGTSKPNGLNQNCGGILGGVGEPVMVDGIKYFGLSHVSRSFNRPLSRIWRQIQSGWLIEEAVDLRERIARMRRRTKVDVGQPGPTEFPSGSLPRAGRR
jgi:hypothetical protein